MYNKGLKIINKKAKEKWQIAQKVIKGILILWLISIEPGTNVKVLFLNIFLDGLSLTISGNCRRPKDV